MGMVMEENPWDPSRPKFVYQWHGTREGHTGAGNLQGHLLSGCIYIGFASFYLLLSLYRARVIAINLQQQQQQQQQPQKQQSPLSTTSTCTRIQGSKTTTTTSVSELFAALHIPERNPLMLRIVGNAFLIICGVGVLIHTCLGIKNSHNIFKFLGHELLNLAFVTAGAAGVLEAQQRLPTDSFRCAMAGAFLVNGLVMWDHAQHNILTQDVQFHLYWAKASLADAAAMAYSVWNPASVVAYCLSWGLMVFTGTWIIVIGFWSCCWDVETHNIVNYFALNIIILVFIFILVPAFCIPRVAQPGNYDSHTIYQQDTDDSSDEEYSPLAINAEDEEAFDPHGELS